MGRGEMRWDGNGKRGGEEVRVRDGGWREWTEDRRQSGGEKGNEWRGCEEQETEMRGTKRI